MGWFLAFLLASFLILVNGKKKKFEEEAIKLKNEIHGIESQAEDAKREAETEISKCKAIKDMAGEALAQNTVLRDSIEAMSNLYVNEAFRRICERISPINLESSKDKLQKVFDSCRKNNLRFPTKNQQAFLNKIETLHADEVRKQQAKEEQARIKEKMREEARVERERQTEVNRIEKEEKLLREALEKAQTELQEKHAEEVGQQHAEIERLRQMLEEKERAKAMAQLTRNGHIYVISNIGSFGEDIFKVGMTRRLEPTDRVRELGDASVPFPFDIHMMIYSDDAPSLESKLHERLYEKRLNKVNDRKEFFGITINEIVKTVEELHGKVEYKAEPEAFEFRESALIAERGENSKYDRSKEENDELEQVA